MMVFEAGRKGIVGTEWYGFRKDEPEFEERKNVEVKHKAAHPQPCKVSE